MTLSRFLPLLFFSGISVLLFAVFPLSSGNVSEPTAEEGSVVVNIWYGGEQTFGQLGQSQSWINVLGNIENAQDVDSATFQLNDQSA